MIDSDIFSLPETDDDKVNEYVKKMMTLKDQSVSGAIVNHKKDTFKDYCFKARSCKSRANIEGLEKWERLAEKAYLDFVNAEAAYIKIYG